jgi:rfaE bifunctional protein nucleotidyltransferase chain/domain
VSPSPKNRTYREFYQKKRIDPSDLERFSNEIKKSGKTLVTLNGSFDLLLQGDILIVALNSDSSIKQYKSQDRPFIPLDERLQMMAALDMVDYVTWFEELDPCLLLSKLKPDVHVNGSEYGENCIEAETVKAYGGRLHIVQLVPGLSTTQIVKRITSACV